MNHEFKEGRDYYINEEGYVVMTEFFLKQRGYCCSMGCLHCPYKVMISPEDQNKDSQYLEGNEKQNRSESI